MNRKVKIHKIISALLKFLLLVIIFSNIVSCRENDKIPPEIYLIGKQDTTILQNEAFEEPGYSATDNRDGDLTPFVSIKGQVDESLAKIYTLQYKVSDKAGNFTFKIRTITVKAQ